MSDMEIFRQIGSQSDYCMSHKLFGRGVWEQPGVVVDPSVKQRTMGLLAMFFLYSVSIWQGSCDLLRGGVFALVKKLGRERGQHEDFWVYFALLLGFSAYDSRHCVRFPEAHFGSLGAAVFSFISCLSTPRYFCVSGHLSLQSRNEASQPVGE